jgi:hypothetical protein
MSSSENGLNSLLQNSSGAAIVEMQRRALIIFFMETLLHQGRL